MKKYISLLIIITLMAINAQGIIYKTEDFGLVLEEEEFFRLRIDLFEDFDLIDIFIESNCTFNILIISPFVKFKSNISYLKGLADKFYNDRYSFNDTISWNQNDYYIYNPNNYSITIHYILEGKNIQKDNDLSYEFSIAFQMLCCMILLIGVPLIPVIILVYYLIKKGKK